MALNETDKVVISNCLFDGLMAFDVVREWDPLFLAIGRTTIQSNFNGSNTFGTMKISSRQG